MDIPDLSRLILLVLCLVLSAFFSASETAFIALPRARLMHLIRIGQPGAERVGRLIQGPNKLLATVLLSNNLVNTGAAVLGTALMVSLLGNDYRAALAATFGVTLTLVVLGEAIPKTIAWHRSEKVAFAASLPVEVTGVALAPAVRVLQGVTSVVGKSVGITGKLPEIDEDEIRSLIAAGAQTGAVEAREAALLEQVFHFGDRRVREIMTPRPEIVWVERGTTLKEFLPIYLENLHTRFPVYEGTTENVVGVIAIKDVLQDMGRERLRLGDSVSENLRPVYFVPETKTISRTFSEMQYGSYGLTLAVDEFGGIAGLVTLKQLLEVIVGQVEEEAGSQEEIYVSLDDHTYLLDAGVSILDINEELSLDLPPGDYQTVAGFILDNLGRIPEEGDVVEHRDFRFTVKQMDGVRVDKVELRTPQSGQEDTGE